MCRSNFAASLFTCIMKVYQEVFGYLIDEFKTYKPIFSAIRKEYDITLGMYFYVRGNLCACKPDLYPLNNDYFKFR